MTADDERRNALLAKGPDERTPAEVEELRTKYAVFGGCCDKFADQCACDCPERARAYEARRPPSQRVFVAYCLSEVGGKFSVYPGAVVGRGDALVEVCFDLDEQVRPVHADRVHVLRSDAEQMCRALNGPPVPAPALGHSGEKYVRKIRSCRHRRPIGEVDVYSVLDAFGPLPAPRAHAVKKLLCAGLRDKGDAARDLREAIDALKEDLKQLEAGE